MNALVRFNEHKPQKEWGYPLSFSFLVHIIIFALAYFATNLAPAHRRLHSVYNVSLVELPSPTKGGLPSGTLGKSVEAEKTAVREPKGVPAPPKVESSRKAAAAAKPSETRIPVQEERKNLQEEYQNRLKSLAVKRKMKEQAEANREEVLKSALAKMKERVSAENSRIAMERQKASMLEKIRKDAGQKDSKVKGAIAGIRERILGEGAGSAKGIGPESRAGLMAERLYEAQVKAKVENNWFDVRQWNQRKDLVTIVIIKLSRSGKVEDCAVRKGSGNRAVDESVKRAIYKSSPFAPVPPEILDTTVEVRFCPGEIIS